MTEIDWLKPVFVENLKSGSLYPYGEVMLPAYRLFEGGLPLFLIGAAVAGAVLGGMTSWMIGLGLAAVRRNRPDFLSDSMYGRMEWVAKRAMPLLVCLSSFPFGGIFPVVAGFFRLSPVTVAGCLAFSRLLVEYNR